MTRWGLVADIWYLSPRSKRTEQSSIEFANEVKGEISRIANLKNLSWDGYWKNYIPSEEKQNRLRDIPRERYGKVLLRRNKSSSSQTGTFFKSRRNSFVHDEKKPPAETFAHFIGQPEWLQNQKPETTSVRNLVLMAIQEQERNISLISIIQNRRDDIVETWRHATSGKSNPLDIRIENLSWRLWFKQRIQKIEKSESDESVLNYSNLFDFLYSFLPIPSRTFDPDDQLTDELSSTDDLPNSGQYISKNWNFDSDL